MIYRRLRRTSLQGCSIRVQSDGRERMLGYGYGDWVVVRDEHGDAWRGQAEQLEDHTLRFRFRDADGHLITGMADVNGVLLRDHLGKIWRGYLE